MTSVAQAAAMRRRLTAPRRYRNPPVHEVVLSLVFGHPVDAAQLEALPAGLRAHFPPPDRQEQVRLEVTNGPGAQQVVSTAREFDGWVFKREDQTRVVSTGRTRLNVHGVRPGQWPTGEYAGWSTIYHDAMKLFDLFAPIYGGLPLERAGLRYLNRIAVPIGSELEDWFTIGFAAPRFLADPYAINLRQTWARIEGHEDLSATIGLATIEIPEPSLQAGHVGFFLDIEVFNLWKHRAPAFEQVPEWCGRAHDVEGDIFESSITDGLRRRLEVIE